MGHSWKSKKAQKKPPVHKNLHLIGPKPIEEEPEEEESDFELPLNPSAPFDNNKNIEPRVDLDEDQEDVDEDVNEEAETTEELEEEMVQVPVKWKHSLKTANSKPEEYFFYMPFYWPSPFF